MPKSLAAPRSLPYPPGILLTATAAATLLAPAVVMVSPLITMVGLAVSALLLGVYMYPPLAAYVLLVTTPLLAGVERGSIVPALRPYEAVVLLVAAGLFARVLIRPGLGRARLPRIRVIDAAIILMAVTSSGLPILWMVARGIQLTLDDLFHALTLWKYYGIYLIIRMSIRTEKQVRRCLWLVMVASAIVALVAVLQSLDLFGVSELLNRYYSPEDDGVLDFRGGSTLAYPIALTDLMTYSLAIAIGWMTRFERHRGVLIAFAGLFLFGLVASGQFSGIIALLVGVVAVGLVTGRLGRLGFALLATAPVVGWVLKPVLEQRLRGFSTPEGLPYSWVTRWQNLETFFWPKLFSGYNFILGVRPAARVPALDSSQHYVWIESGHTWLLWAGGIPFFVAFFVFLWVSIRWTVRIARVRTDAIGVAAIASFASLVVLAVMMTLDPHLTMRGSADLLFSLLALACTCNAQRWPRMRSMQPSISGHPEAQLLRRR